MTDFKLGNYVEVDIGMALRAKGKIVGENAVNRVDMSDMNHARRSSSNTFKILFLDGSTHTALPSELHLLSEKETFILKLKGDEDKEMAKIYEAMDNG